MINVVLADIYLHNPRGCNNRLNEKSANRANGNRLFDSQNNNRGGYNVGDKYDTPSANDQNKQYMMKYFQSSKNEGKTYLTLEWTHQHGCGGNKKNGHKLHCDNIIQYMCQDNIDSVTGTKSEDIIRNGAVTKTPNYTPPTKDEEKDFLKRRDANIELQVGYHESYSWYDKCYMRESNNGLFRADQNLKKNKFGYSSAIHTRQNPGGAQNGYECPEERDYYPYWHPSLWKDAAVLTDPSLCKYYVDESFNVKPRFECIEKWLDTNTKRHYSRWNNKQDCVQNNGKWTELFNFLEKAPQFNSEDKCVTNSINGLNYLWAVPYDTLDGITKECLVPLSAPKCTQAQWTRDNHLGNTPGGYASNFTITLPYFPSEKDKRCIIRIRYNITTGDYDRFKTDFNYNKNSNQKSPIENNPYVNIGANNQPLRLAINTAQFGRTFQDRTHAFILRKRPVNLLKNDIYNLNVRGKRGNIVQVYPAVEYDFFPTDLHLKENELVHIQWTGSNTHNNQAPGGDGQTGDDGQGRGGTDRNNLVEMPHRNSNYPLSFENSTLSKNMKVKWIFNNDTNLDPTSLALMFASTGYYHCVYSKKCAVSKSAADKKPLLDNLLDNAPASFEGVVVQIKKGTYYYMCTRNNNFSNRSQKGTIHVK